MAFPTIPTVASADLLSSTTSTASTTHTFPNLSSLRGGAGPQAGDLLIAICVQYGAATAGNQYSSWGASFLEMLDDSLSSGTGVGALGIAYKIATGSESGTFTVTSVTSAKSVQFLMRIPSGTWHGTTIPQVQAATRATGLASDPASFDPSNWDAADTLWIAVAGQTETSTTGSPPTLDSPPANYSGQLIVARAADTVGDITAGVAFRQVNASAEDVGTWTATNANRGNGIATIIAVRPAQATLFGQIAFPITFVKDVAATRQTFSQISAPFTFVKDVAGISFASPKSTAIAEISLASHGTPTEQTNHSIKIRARTTTGSTGVIKAALYEGATNRSGDLTSSTLTNSLTLYSLDIPDASAANITDYSDLSIRFWGYDSAGNVLVFEVAEVYLELPEAGVTTFYGAVSQVTTFSKAVSGFKQTFGQTATPITFTKAVSGIRKTFSQIVTPFTFTKSVSGARTALGQIVAPFTFIKNIVGERTTFGQTVTSLTFARVISGVRTTFSQIVTPFIFSKTVSGQKTTFSSIDLPLIFIDQTSGRKQTFGNVVFPINFVFDVVAETQGIRFGQTSMSLVFEKEAAGHRETFGRVAIPFNFDSELNGILEAFSSIDFPINLVVDVNTGRIETYSSLDLDFLLNLETAGMIKPIGIILNLANAIYLGSTSVDSVYSGSQKVWP